MQMTVQEELINILHSLPHEKQEEILSHARSIAQTTKTVPAKRRLRGLCAGLGMDISEGEIAELRKEMWGNFPRDFSV
jgi:hypothetical protein